jgi:hypothetical protein
MSEIEQLVTAVIAFLDTDAVWGSAHPRMCAAKALLRRVAIAAIREQDTRRHRAGRARRRRRVTPWGGSARVFPPLFHRIPRPRPATSHHKPSGPRIRAMILDCLSDGAVTGTSNPFFPAGSTISPNRVIGRR